MLPATFSPIVWLSDIPLETLIARLTAADPRDRALAACALRERPSAAARAARSLASLLGDSTAVDPRTRNPARLWPGHDLKPTSPGAEAARALVAIGAAASHQLVRASTASNAFARRQATWALGALNDARAVPPVIARLCDEDAHVREQAAWALGAIGDPRGLNPLTLAVEDQCPDVRKQAAWASGVLARRDSASQCGRGEPDVPHANEQVAGRDPQEHAGQHCDE